MLNYMKCLFIFLLYSIFCLFTLFNATSSYYYMPSIDVISPTPSSPLIRTVYYPLQTNCQNQCFLRNPYQWVYRPIENSIIPSLPYISSNSLIMPSYQTLYKPFNLSQSHLTSTKATITTTSLTPTTTQSTITEEIQKLILELKPTPAETLETVSKKKSKLVSLPSFQKLIQELPTPPPYNQINQNLPKKLENPCSNGNPLLNKYQNPVTCNFNIKPNGGCPDQYWCHTGSSFETTTCCLNSNIKERCNLARKNGEGDELIPRWYYDTTLHKCKRFLYKGLKGNPNNFITSIQCMETCETTDQLAAYKNPCASGPPARNLEGELFECSSFSKKQKNYNKCPAGYYCHIGEGIETTACCELSSVKDLCLLSVNKGEGNSNLKRFFFDISTKNCVEFSYRGIRGNENNFLTIAECKAACIKYNNPCQVTLDFTNRKECSLENSNVCDKHEWCHIGSSQESSICCPGAVLDPCKLPLDFGQGNENLTRWYADPADSSCNRQCRQFDYKGAKGNQNNFISKLQCEIICKHCFNPCSSGEVLIESSTNQPKLCNTSNTCPVNYWCHLGATPEISVCCSSVKSACSLPVEEGFGKAVLSRWYYDNHEKICKKFIYQGMGGNQNSFLSKDDCLNACPTENNPCSGGFPLMIANEPKICSPKHRCPNTHFCHIGIKKTENYCCPKNGDPCEHQVSPGLGTHSITRYYYDKKNYRCSEFKYKGSKGNANNFLSKEDCEMICQTSATKNPCQSGTPLIDEITNESIICGGEKPCPLGYWCHIGGSPETTNCCSVGTKSICELPLEVGQGDSNLERWYYDNNEQSCKSFIYTGLKGNANNFYSLKLCEETCHIFNPCLIGKPLLNNKGQLEKCQSDQPFDSCPKNYYCHASSTSDTKNVCCIQSNTNPCELLPNNNNSINSIKRWFYNSALNKCEQFQYSGVGGNENNFISKEICENNCPRYKKFCPHGSPLLNKTQNPIECSIKQSCPYGYVCHMNTKIEIAICCEDPSHFCLHARDSGSCDKDEQRYGYNPLTDTCVPYLYSGCGGTLNNFKTINNCKEICCREYKHRLRNVSK